MLTYTFFLSMHFFKVLMKTMSCFISNKLLVCTINHIFEHYIKGNSHKKFIISPIFLMR